MINQKINYELLLFFKEQRNRAVRASGHVLNSLLSLSFSYICAIASALALATWCDLSSKIYSIYMLSNSHNLDFLPGALQNI